MRPISVLGQRVKRLWREVDDICGIDFDDTWDLPGVRQFALVMSLPLLAFSIAYRTLATILVLVVITAVFAGLGPWLIIRNARELKRWQEANAQLRAELRSLRSQEPAHRPKRYVRVPARFAEEDE